MYCLVYFLQPTESQERAAIISGKDPKRAFRRMYPNAEPTSEFKMQDGDVIDGTDHYCVVVNRPLVQFGSGLRA